MSQKFIAAMFFGNSIHIIATKKNVQWPTLENNNVRLKKHVDFFFWIFVVVEQIDHDKYCGRVDGKIGLNVMCV